MPKDEAIRLLEYALTLCMYGENAPGGTETWRQFATDCERFLRGQVEKAEAEAIERDLLEATRAVVRRLYTALGETWRTTTYPHREAAAREFYRAGFPPDEREALLVALPATEVAWIESDD